MIDSNTEGGDLLKRDLIVAVLLTFCLTVLLFQVLPISSQDAGDYDPWYDVNDDGLIDMRDVGGIARKFGTSGTSINKTALILELQQNITVLREEMIALQLWVGHTVVGMIYDLNATIEQRLPQREVISIPAAAFTPYLDYSVPPTDWWNRGYYLTNKNGTNEIRYVAPVQLPHGVNVTRVYIFWYDAGVERISSRLYKSEANHTTSGSSMVGLSSPEKTGPGWGSSNTNIIEHSIIDNYYQYHMFLYIPPSDVPLNPDYYFYYAIIEYEYPE